jgi:hypothetical protein
MVKTRIMNAAQLLAYDGKACAVNCNRLIRLYIYTASLLLFITGMAKVISSFGTAHILTHADPILDIRFGNLMLFLGIGELVISGICLFSKDQRRSLGLIAWLCTMFLVYRMGLLVIGWQKPCACLGYLTDALRISPHAVDLAMKWLLAYLLVGSYVGLMCHRSKRGVEPL